MGIPSGLFIAMTTTVYHLIEHEYSLKVKRARFLSSIIDLERVNVRFKDCLFGYLRFRLVLPGETHRQDSGAFYPSLNTFPNPTSN